MALATKEQERQAIQKVRKIIEIKKENKEPRKALMKRRNKYVQIMARATVLSLMNESEATERLMDIESADLKFNMRLDDWLKSDDFNFAHDFLGIRDNIVRYKFPSKDFGLFIPRFAGIYQ